MKKLLLGLLIAGAIVIVAAYFIAHYLVDKGSRRFLDRMVANAEERGFKISDASLDETDFSFLSRKIEWGGLSAAVRSDFLKESYGIGKLDFEIGNLVFGSADKRYEALYLAMEDGGFRFSGVSKEGLPWRLKRVKIDRGQIGLQIPQDNMDAAVNAALSEIARIWVEGRSQLPIDLEASVDFDYDGESMTLGIRSLMESDGEYALEVDRGDIREIADRMGLKVTEPEIEVVATHPLQAPQLLAISKLAEETSKEAARRDPSVPEDAYRHLLWSYWLTESVGESLAKKVTDAYEEGSTSNTEADHRMDYNNNEVGRRYAKEGVAVSDIIELAKTDPDVIREPR